MARMRNKVTDSVVNVTDEKAKRLGSEWEPADAPKRTSKKADSKSDDK